jgi:hypothetical protein
VADDHFSDVAICATNFSRIDVQETVRINNDVGAQIIEHLNEAYAYADTLKQEREVRIIASRRKGNTLYLNERVSSSFGRIYDKHRESRYDFYKNCIRYEVECKSELAQAVARRIQSQPVAADAACGIVSGWMVAHGIKGLTTSVADLDMVRCDRKHTSDERRLLWLNTQVRPSLERLARNGKLKLAIEALGLSKGQLEQIVKTID